MSDDETLTGAAAADVGERQLIGSALAHSASLETTAAAAAAAAAAIETQGSLCRSSLRIGKQIVSLCITSV